jgi:hypothetical protein
MISGSGSESEPKGYGKGKPLSRTTYLLGSVIGAGILFFENPAKITSLSLKLMTNMNIVFVQEQLSGTPSTAAKARSWTLSAMRAE